MQWTITQPEEGRKCQFATTWVQLEIIIAVKPGRQIPYDIVYTQNLKYDTRILYKTETDSQTHRTGLWLPGDAGREGQIGSLGLADANYMCVIESLCCTPDTNTTL